MPPSRITTPLLVLIAGWLLIGSASAHEIDPQVLLSEHYKLMMDYRGGTNFTFGMPGRSGSGVSFSGYGR